MLILAHRGYSSDHPENTLRAFEAALEAEVDGIELDVHRTADGVLIVHHDAVPLAECDDPRLLGRPFAELTADEVRQFRVQGTEPIPTLRDVFALVGDRAEVFCELKGAGTAAPTVALIQETAVRGAVHSFDHRQVAHALRLAPNVPRGVLETAYHLDNTLALLSVGARDLWQQWQMIDSELVRAVHAAGGRVIAWTVNAPPRIAALAKMGVDAVCTDDPGRAA